MALGFCLIAVAASFAVVSSDRGAFEWRWWLLAFPLGACVAAVLVPVRNVLIGAAIVMTCWCVVSGFSVGLFFVPSLVAMIVAVSQGDRRPGAE